MATYFTANGADIFPTEANGEAKQLTELELFLYISVSRILSRRAAMGQATILMITGEEQVVETHIPPHAVISCGWDHPRFVPPLEDGVEESLTTFVEALEKPISGHAYFPLNIPQTLDLLKARMDELAEADEA